VKTSQFQTHTLNDGHAHERPFRALAPLSKVGPSRTIEVTPATSPTQRPCPASNVGNAVRCLFLRGVRETFSYQVGVPLLPANAQAASTDRAFARRRRQQTGRHGTVPGRSSCFAGRRYGGNRVLDGPVPTRLVARRTIGLSAAAQTTASPDHEVCDLRHGFGPRHAELRHKEICRKASFAQRSVGISA
jgi:hypothetical protein